MHLINWDVHAFGFYQKVIRIRISEFHTCRLCTMPPWAIVARRVQFLTLFTMETIHPAQNAACTPTGCPSVGHRASSQLMYRTTPRIPLHTTDAGEAGFELSGVRRPPTLTGGDVVAWGRASQSAGVVDQSC